MEGKQFVNTGRCSQGICNPVCSNKSGIAFPAELNNALMILFLKAIFQFKPITLLPVIFSQVFFENLRKTLFQDLRACQKGQYRLLTGLIWDVIE